LFFANVCFTLSQLGLWNFLVLVLITYVFLLLEEVLALLDALELLADVVSEDK
jgi:hypothetical protein